MNAHWDWVDKGIPYPNECAIEYYYTAWVTDVADQSISLRGARDNIERTFQLSASLAAGQGPTSVKDHNKPYFGESDLKYRRADVLIGDRVRVYFGRVNGVDICDAISIERRPGGHVPPPPVLDRSKIPHNVRMNLLQEWETTGGPWPEQLGPPHGIYIAPYPTEVIPRAKP